MTSVEGRGMWEQYYGKSQSVWGWAPNRFVAEVLGPLPAGRALDLAAGEGRNALWLAGLGWQSTAVDFAENALERGRAQAVEHGLKVEWVLADVLEYRPEPGAYDAVVIAYLHLETDPLTAVLHNAAKALAPGGTLVVVGHDVTNIADGVGGPQNPAILYTPERVTEALERLTDADMKIVRAERVHRQTDRAPQPAIDTLVVAQAS